jgi:1-acyl-sn-glycerol-3-phosphate acyltransferase
MLRKLFKYVFLAKGWTLISDYPKDIKKSVMIAAPHTSNLDFVYAVGAFELLDIFVRFTIKKEWLRFPFNLIMTPLGAIPIDRSPKEGRKDKKSMVDAMSELFDKHEELVVLVTPEGTRSKVENWKTGFYYVALNTGVPILCSFMDYAKKEAGVGKVVYPTGDFEKDMAEIMAYYKQFTPKHPEKFSVDVRFAKSPEQKAEEKP